MRRWIFVLLWTALVSGLPALGQSQGSNQGQPMGAPPQLDTARIQEEMHHASAPAPGPLKISFASKTVDLTAEQRTQLATYPRLPRVAVGSVHLALEAKAAMTEHIKALPRLFDELNSSHLAIHGSADFAIAAGFAVVNYSATFVSTDRNKHNLGSHAAVVTAHKQPKATERTIKKLEEIPRRTHGGAEGFDALGIVVLELRNDGTPVTVVTQSPAPAPADVWYYDQMIRRISSLYANKFGNV